MAHPLRPEFEDAIYHVMARGISRQKIFLEHEDYRKLSEGLARTVKRCGWLVMAYCWMPFDEDVAARPAATWLPGWQPN